MNILLLKRILRLLVGLFSSGMIRGRKNRNKLYVNLSEKSELSGPGRFLKNFYSVLQERNINISNWSLKGCSAALVLSASWGDSFSWICRRNGIRSVLRVDGFYVPEVFGPGKKRRLTDSQKWVNKRLKADLEHFDHVIYQSAFSKEQADIYLFNRTEAYSIIHNGVDVHHFIPKPNVVRDKQPTIIVVGKHYPENIALAMNVFKIVNANKSAQLLIVGPMRDGSSVAKHIEIENRNWKLINKDVTCLGTISYEKLPEILARADVFLHVKIGDWCPNAVAEALSCGLPVVCPDWGGTKELVASGGIAVNGLPWTADDSLINGMVDAVIKLLNDLDRYKILARETAVLNLDKYYVALKYLRVLDFDK